MDFALALIIISSRLNSLAVRYAAKNKDPVKARNSAVFRGKIRTFAVSHLRLTWIGENLHLLQRRKEKIAREQKKGVNNRLQFPRALCFLVLPASFFLQPIFVIEE